MASKLLLTVAASALFTVPAFAQVNLGGGATGALGATAQAAGQPVGGVAAGAGMGAETGLNASAQAPDVVTPAASTAAKAKTKAAKSASAAAATASDAAGSAAMAGLRAGASVRDAAGAEVGKVLEVTPGEGGASSTVTLGLDGKTATVPASSLTPSGDALVSSSAKADIWAEATASAN